LNTEKDRIVSELLLIRYLRGDTSAFDELVRHWQGRLFYYVMRLLSNEEDAWDALQDTWIAVARNAGKLSEPHSLVPWLYKIARNKAVDRLKTRYDQQAVSMDCDDIAAAEEDVGITSFADADLVHAALEKVSLGHREVLTLYFLRDLTMEEISQVLAVAPGTIKSRLHFAKKALRAVLEEEGLTP
jgi:RNA polymerase sigma factor (sigma-70 family)